MGFIHFKMRGTTFTGHPTSTTLGNTLRSIMYIKYAKKFLDFPVFHLAAGDDVCAWVPKDKALLFKHTIETKVSHTDKKHPLPHGLG